MKKKLLLRMLVAGIVYFLLLGERVNALNDVEIKLNSADGSTVFTVQDSGANNVATIDSDGNAVFKGTMTIEGSVFSVGGSTFVIKEGNVGIGTTDPLARLQVVESGTQDLLVLSTGTLSGQNIMVVKNSGNLELKGDIILDEGAVLGPSLLLYDETSIPWEIRNYSKRLRFFRASEQMTLLSNGRLGLGVVAPEGRLHVDAGGDAYAALFMNGRVGIETTSPGAALDINSPTTNSRSFQARVGTTYGLVVSTTGSVSIIASMPTEGYELQVGYAGDGSEAISNGWDLFSDRKWKKNISDLTQPEISTFINKLKKARISKYHYKGDRKGRKFRIGFLAEDAPEEILSENKKAISLGDSMGMLMAVVQVQSRKIEELEKRLKVLEQKR